MRTSGSTGTKLVFHGTDDTYKKEAAFILRAYRNHGATLYDKPSIWLRRYVPKSDNDPLWYYDHELKRLFMSAYHMNPERLPAYLAEMRKKNYHTLVGYPSSIYSLACLLEETGLEPPDIEAIHVASEKMLPQWADKIEDIFGIRPKAHYGQIEKVSLFHQRSGSDDYYEDFEYGLTEFVKENNELVVVGTGFLNDYMPFIRYKTNDTVSLHDNGTVQDFNGRCDDILIAEDGSRLPGVNFYTMMYKIDGIKMFELRQKTREELDVFVVLKSDINPSNTIIKLREGLERRLGKLHYNMNIVDEIKRNKRTGKIRCIYNEI